MTPWPRRPGRGWGRAGREVAGLGLDWGPGSSEAETQAQWVPRGLSLELPACPQRGPRLSPRSARPRVTPLCSLHLRAQRGSWPGRSAGATGSALQTAFRGHLFQGEPRPGPRPSPSSGEAPEEEAAEKNQRAAAPEQTAGDLR